MERQGVKDILSYNTDFGRIVRITRVGPLLRMVNSAPDFADQPKVANGTTDLLAKIYGHRGSHARSAVGIGGLPNGICIEIAMIVEVAN